MTGWGLTEVVEGRKNGDWKGQQITSTKLGEGLLTSGLERVGKMVHSLVYSMHKFSLPFAALVNQRSGSGRWLSLGDCGRV